MTTPDLTAAMRWPLVRQDAWKTFVGIALCSFIPLVGPFVFLGWQKRAFDAARSGQELPRVDIGADIGAGFHAFVALTLTILPLFLPFVLVLVPVVIIAPPEEGGEPPIAFIIAMVLSQLLMAVGILAINLLTPELLRRTWKGAWAPAFSPFTSLRAIRAAPTGFLMALVGTFVAQLVASLGMFACYFGVFVTMPWAMAVSAHLIAQYDRMVPEDA